MLRTSAPIPDGPRPFQDAFVDAAEASGLSWLDDPSDPACPLGVARSPRNIVDGSRWNAAFAYLDAARDRPNLRVVPDTLVDRVVLDGSRATGVLSANGLRYDCGTAMLAAGAYFSPAILARSGIGPARALESLGIPVAGDLPVGARLLDHYGTDVSWGLSERGLDATAGEAFATGHFGAQTVIKAASSRCPDGTWDLHLLPLLVTRDDGALAALVLVFHMKPLSAGRVRLRSTDPRESPTVERGFLTEDEDVRVLVDGIELARTIAGTEPLRALLGAEQLPGERRPEDYLRETVRNYFHPAGTCAIGEVVDTDCRVLGIEGLLVVDASIMPTIPRANTNLTTAGIAERIAATLGS
jgi:choline dehydrogenase